jgi:hypothetical protein
MTSAGEIYSMSPEQLAAKRSELHISLFKNIFVLMAIKWTIIILGTKYLTHVLKNYAKD